MVDAHHCPLVNSLVLDLWAPWFQVTPILPRNRVLKNRVHVWLLHSVATRFLRTFHLIDFDIQARDLIHFLQDFDCRIFLNSFGFWPRIFHFLICLDSRAGSYIYVHFVFWLLFFCSELSAWKFILRLGYFSQKLIVDWLNLWTYNSRWILRGFL